MTASLTLEKRSSALVRILLEVSERLAIAESLHRGIEEMNELMSHFLESERSAVFLINEVTDELFSRITDETGNELEIQIYKNKGIAGWCFMKNRSVICNHPYSDDRFEDSIDTQTGLKTRNILSTPIRTLTGRVIGVAEAINRKEGEFTDEDLYLMEAITEQATISLNHLISQEKFAKSKRSHDEFMEIISSISSELELNILLNKTMEAITHLLDAERSTLFVHDEKTKELYTIVGEGLQKNEIRIKEDQGIAGSVFKSRESLNIPYPYADLRFNPEIDRATGFFTRSILCVPVINKNGKVLGVSQVLNKKAGSFTSDDVSRLAAFSTQISMAIENAMLFEEVSREKEYNMSILNSMKNGLITTDSTGFIESCNPAARSMIQERERDLVGKPADECFSGKNAWLTDALRSDRKEDQFMDREFEFKGKKFTTNVSILPFHRNGNNKKEDGSIILIEDITAERRMKSTMSRYMDPGLVDKLLKDGSEQLGGKNSIATILFSDIRSFTTITEELGPQGTVLMLNDYFSDMIDVITEQGGMLDKFIGDAIMAIFGAPFPHEDDPDRALNAAIGMMHCLELFNQKRKSQGLLTIDHGIGLNTDEIISGNIGSKKRMDYTVIGDGVNLAARLESACKQYGAHILISEYTFQACKTSHTYREIDKVIVKGKTQPVRIYEILDYHNDRTFPNMHEVLGYFRSGLEFYQKGVFQKAKNAFGEAYKLHSGDKASKLYLDRCEKLIQQPPEQEWNGVWIMMSK